MNIPTEKHQPTRTDPLILLLYGSPKVGKTEALTQLDGCYILELERSRADSFSWLGCDIPKLADAEGIPTWKCFEEVVKAIKGKYHTLAVDTVTVMERYADARATYDWRNGPMYSATKQDHMKSVVELPHNTGWRRFWDAFHQYLYMLCDACERLILVGHVRDREIDKTAASGADSKDIDLTGRVRLIACQNSDSIGFMSRNDEGNVFLDFSTSDQRNCGSSCAHLRGKSLQFGELIDGKTTYDWRQVYTQL
jgi:hypothetical protein